MCRGIRKKSHCFCKKEPKETLRNIIVYSENTKLESTDEKATQQVVLYSLCYKKY